MIKKFEFDNSANKALVAEILTHRDRQPRMAFLSSLAVVMVTAISLTMVFGRLSTAAVPLEQPEQPYVSSVTDGDTPPPEVVTRVHTETHTETVYDASSQLSKALLTPNPVRAESPAADKSLVSGKSLFNQKQKRYQWQYVDETFTFFVKNNTIYRRNETTGKTTALYKGDGKVSLFCITDRYLFFSAEAPVNYSDYTGDSAYCYRADLLTGEVLRLFFYAPYGYQTKPEVFVRFDGTDVIFTHYIVHEDGSYEEIPDEPEENDTDNPYSDRTLYDNISLYLNDDNTISAEDCYGNIYNLGVNVDYIESLGYKTDFDSYYKGWIYGNKNGEKYIEVPFYPAQFDSSATLSYYGRITGNGLEGGLIKKEISDLPDMSYYTDFIFTNLYVFYDYDDKNFSIPLDFDKLTAATPSELERYFSGNGKVSITITYYPCNALNVATADSAGK